MVEHGGTAGTRPATDALPAGQRGAADSAGPAAQPDRQSGAPGDSQPSGGRRRGDQAPEADRYGYSETYLRGRITGALGGRAAEQVVYGDVTTGAENDMEHASSIARQMVGRWGMSPAIGPVSVLPSSGQESSTGTDGVAPATRELIDTETRRIIEECYQQAADTLRGNRDRLDRLARTLLDRETLDEDEAYTAAGIACDTAPATAAPTPAG
jgi:cell division protease FtsH